VINLTDLDLRYADHAARVERVNGAGWMREGLVPTGGRRAGAATGAGQTRRHIGQGLVSIGEWLIGTPGVRATTLASGAYSRSEAL